MWLTFALLSAALYAVAEILDNFFANKEFKDPMALVFYSSLFHVVYIPILYVAQHPALPPIGTLPIFAVLGFVNIAYLYPYYRGLATDDTSVAISFLAIERILVPIIAFLIVGEVLQSTQYIGIAVIILSVVLLGLHHTRKKFHLSKAVWYIALAALFLAVEAVLYKLLLDKGLSAATVVGGEAFFSLLFGISIALAKKVRRSIVSSYPVFKSILMIFLVEELFSFLGNLSSANAIARAPVSIVQGVTMTSPFFLVIYAWIGSGVLPFIFKEDLHRKKIVHKIALFALLIIGVMLVKE